MSLVRRKSFVYILCNRHRNVIYVGCTEELRKRIYFHRKRLIPGFTKKYNVDRLVYFEEFNNLVDALRRETQIKNYRGQKKVELIRFHPEIEDFRWSRILRPFSRKDLNNGDDTEMAISGWTLIKKANPNWLDLYE